MYDHNQYHKQQSQEVKEIIYRMAVDMGYEDYSTIEDIDYKFWEDIEPQIIAYKLANALAISQNGLRDVISKLDELKDIVKK